MWKQRVEVKGFQFNMFLIYRSILHFNIRSIYWSIFQYSFNILIHISIFVQYIDRYLNIFRCYFQYFIGYINTILSLFQCCRNNFRYVIDHINTCSSKYRRRFFFIEKPVFCVSIIINMILKIFQYSWKYLQYISRNGKCISSGGLVVTAHYRNKVDNYWL